MGMLLGACEGTTLVGSSGPEFTRRGWIALMGGRMGVGWRTCGIGSRWGYCVSGLAAVREGWRDTHAVGHAALRPGCHAVLGLGESFQMVIPSVRQRPDVLALGKNVKDASDHDGGVAGDGRIRADW